MNDHFDIDNAIKPLAVLHIKRNRLEERASHHKLQITNYTRYIAESEAALITIHQELNEYYKAINTLENSND